MPLLPFELNSLIVELCSDCPSSLAVLARTHISFQGEAEKALYDTLSIDPLSDDSLKCMETLSSNPEKAALVRSLTINHGYKTLPVNPNSLSMRTRNRRVTTFLSKSLINMRSLSDFRVTSHSIDFHGQIINGVTKILCESHVRLQTFYCHYVNNVSRIIKSQSELQLLGLGDSSRRSHRAILKTLRKLRDAQILLPIVFTSGYIFGFKFYCNFYKIGIFPAFCSVDRRATIPEIMARFYGDQAKHVIQLCIYLIDSSDMPSIYALAKEMIVKFPRIRWLDLWFERRCDIPLPQIEEKFSYRVMFVDKFVWPDF